MKYIFFSIFGIMYTSKIEDFFKLPIHYISDKSQLNDNIITDLELCETMDPSGISIYENTFSPKTKPGKEIMKQIAKHYTTNTSFLKDTQLLLKKYDSNLVSRSHEIDDILELWDELKNDTGFKDKYHYIDWAYWEHLNNSELFLQAMSMYNLASPFISICIPIFILVVPFFIIKAKGMDISIKEYIEVLKVLASNHVIGRLCNNFNQVSSEQKVYLLMSVGLYIFSIYQNYLTCIRFYANMKQIHISLCKIRNYIEETIKNMNNFLLYTSELPSYCLFNEEIRINIESLTDFQDKLDNIRGDNFTYKNINQIGSLLKYFYELYNDNTCNKCFMYSFGFYGYMDNLTGLVEHIKEKNINLATFNKKKKNIFKNAYYPALINNNPVKNTIKLDKNIIITGPNASGKTTMLKTNMINIILSQQFGCGFYSKANINPYHYIHCYLNIPDTSARDSLFQAEARRCKDIIDVINNNPDFRHFCAFDELYSGTNPDEDVMSAFAFMTYLIKHSNVECILTTHFIEVCKKLDKHKKIENYHMKTKNTENNFIYTYLIKKGISEVHGGIKVLYDMQYPDEIIKNSQFSK